MTERRMLPGPHGSWTVRLRDDETGYQLVVVVPPGEEEATARGIADGTVPVAAYHDRAFVEGDRERTEKERA